MRPSCSSDRPLFRLLRTQWVWGLLVLAWAPSCNNQGTNTNAAVGGASARGGNITPSGGVGGSAGSSVENTGGTAKDTGGQAGGTGGSGAGGSTTSTDPGDASDSRGASVEDAARADVDANAGVGVDVSVDVALGPDLPASSGYLHVEGSKLVDSRGTSVRLTGVNWFGFETSNESPHGTWARDYRSMIKQIHDVGFNSIRLPWSNAILRPNATAQSVNTSGKDPYDGTDPMNADLKGKSPLEMLDLVVQAAGEFGIKLILDDHSRDPDAYDKEEVWYTASTSEAQWIADWVAMVKRYAGNPTVVAVDLDNEPHGKASWGKGDITTDWNTAAEKCGNAILEANPDVLIVVEGVSIVGTDTYWWGGNLSGAKNAPIKLNPPDKLVYSAHEYGPEVHDQTWFTDAQFPTNLPAVWTPHFDFLMKQNLGHVLIGEFGIKDRAGVGGSEGKWFDTLLGTLGNTYSWSYWCWNPNSGDTGGILSDDWVTPVQWKMDALKPYLAPMFEK